MEEGVFTIESTAAGTPTQSVTPQPQQEVNSLRLISQIILGILLPFILIGICKIIIWILFNPFIFFCIWITALLIGMISTLVIEFDYHHGYPEEYNGQSHMNAIELVGYFAVGEYSNNDQRNENDSEEEEEQELVQTGLSGQGESPVDQNPSQGSSNTSNRSRPLKMRGNNSGNISRSPGGGSGTNNCIDGTNSPCSTIPEIEEESVQSFFPLNLHTTSNSNNPSSHVVGTDNNASASS